MAKKLTPSAVARLVVVRDGSVFTLAVNEDFQGRTITAEGGVEYPDAAEVRLAQAGLALAVIQTLQPPDLAAWAQRVGRRSGGNPRLAEQLVALAPDPKHSETAQRNMLRKLQEWGQGKYKRASGINARRVALYRLATETERFLLGVTGNWDGAGPHGAEVYRRFNTQVKDPNETPEALAALGTPDGAGIIAAVITSANKQAEPYEVDLLTLAGLHAQFQPVGKGN